MSDTRRTGLSRRVFDRVPVFALENYALFPFTVAALQVFEPASREMIDDCQATDRLLVVTGLESEWADAGGLAPPVHAIAGLGKLVNARSLEDGSREVYLNGIARVRILRFTQETPYRLAQVERVDDESSRSDRWRLRANARRLHNYLNGLIRQGLLGDEVSRVVAASDDPAVLTYRLGAILLRDPQARQRLLEQRSPLDRVDTLIDAMAETMLQTKTSAEEAMGDRAGNSPSIIN